jgi:hypothetical protein
LAGPRDTQVVPFTIIQRDAGISPGMIYKNKFSGNFLHYKVIYIYNLVEPYTSLQQYK